MAIVFEIMGIKRENKGVAEAGLILGISSFALIFLLNSFRCIFIYNTKLV